MVVGSGKLPSTDTWRRATAGSLYPSDLRSAEYQPCLDVVQPRCRTVCTHQCSQVTVEYKRDPECQGALVPKRVHTILISTQHSPDVTNEQIRKVRARMEALLWRHL